MHTNVTTDRHVRIVSAYSLESWNRDLQSQLAAAYSFEAC